MSDTRFHDGTAAHEAEYRPREHRQTRWPKPDALSLVFFAVWVVGILVSTVIPFLIVPPTSTDPDSGAVGLAFLASMVGIGIFVVAGLLMWRHLKSQAVLVFALVPAVSVGSGAIILTATLLAL
ncbi:hypothetical protein [Aquipuribacter hungaricus]|uniref:MFS transporter n=1 Tax=Aquipuribacter hungaricus TaxID=545624 RepID=A0ABV7WLD7_9MICO